MYRYLSVILFALLTVLFPSCFNVKAAGNLTQNSSRECAICHFRWVDQFVEGHGTALAEYEAEDVAGVEMMCLSCHDGSTVDSRSKIWLHDMHKTGVKPSEKVKIPKRFPLSPTGEMVCATCHSAHSNPTDTSIERSVFLRITNNDSILCEMCHVNQTTIENNHPLHTGNTPLPEQLFAEGASLSFTDPNHVICESCHTAHASVEKTLVHTMAESAICIICHTDKIDANTTLSSQGVNHPLKVKFKTDSSANIVLQAGENNTLQCLSCHKVHEHAPGTKALVAPRDPLCSFCHADKDDRLSSPKTPHVNHPLAVPCNPAGDSGTQLDIGANKSVQCFTCHRIHQHSPGTKGLAVERDRLCSSCHAEKYLVEGTDHDLSGTAPSELNSAGQGSRQYGVCVSCHVPHKANGPFLWSRSDLGENVSPSTLCLSCHTKEGPAAKKGIGDYSHPVGVKVTNTPQLPLSTLDNGELRMECHTCHDPHRWRPGSHEKGEGGNIEGDGTSSFLRATCGTDQKLCSLCHPEQERVVQTDHDLRITGPGHQNSVGKTVAQTGVCSACHVPHNGSGPMLWAQTLQRKGKSTSFLCLSCHNKQGIAAKKTVGKYSHPVGIAVSSSSGLPLHKINKTTSVMECSTCHNPHTWRPDKQQLANTKNVEGDGLSSFLREPNVGEPVLCNKCHLRQGMVAGTEHDLRVFAPAGFTSNGTPTTPVSICSPCHTVHNASNQATLWNSVLPSYKKDFMAQACYSCHNSEGVGKEKLIKVGSHPRKIHFGYNKPYAGTSSPRHGGGKLIDICLYDKDGQKKMSGEISCPTCHDPHLWQSGKLEKGPGVNLEGTTMNSFLKKEIRKVFCYECHGLKTLFLYRYYHVVKKRKQLMGPYSPKFRSLPSHNTRLPSIQHNYGQQPNTFVTKTHQGSACNECHKDLSDSHYQGNNPFLDDAVREEAVRSGMMDDNGQPVCSSCHDQHGEKDEKGLFSAAYKALCAKSRAINPHFDNDHCLSCHTKEPIKDNAFLRENGNASALCNRCHASSYARSDIHPVGIHPSQHIRIPNDMPLENGMLTCTTCHDPLQQGGCKTKENRVVKTIRFLRGKYKSLTTYCFICHFEEMYKRLNPHEQINEQGKIKEESCLFCHASIPNIHYLGTEKVSFIIKNPDAYCIGCHHGFTKKHPAGVDHLAKPSRKILASLKTSIQRIGVELPLYKGKVVCATCHNPHQTGIIKIPAAAAGTQRENKLRLRPGPMQCVGCHWDKR